LTVSALLEWPQRLQQLGRELRLHPNDRLGGDLWKLLFDAIALYAHRHARSLTGFSHDDIEDIAAQKALDLLNRIVSGRWEPDARSPGEVAAFLSKTARNALIDTLRADHRRSAENVETQLDRETNHFTHQPGAAEPPDLQVERRDFAEALKGCAGGLAPRARRAWFLRVFCEMPSKEIATHPGVGLKPGHVDVLLQRCREMIRACMRKAGFEPHEMPPGTFVELWKLFNLEKPHG